MGLMVQDLPTDNPPPPRPYKADLPSYPSTQSQVPSSVQAPCPAHSAVTKPMPAVPRFPPP